MKKFYRFLFRLFGVVIGFGAFLLILGGAPGAALAFGLLAVAFFWKAKNMGKQDGTEQTEDAPAVSDPAPVVPAVEALAQAQNVKKYKVAGVTHYVDNILELATEDPDYDLSKRELIAEDRVQERVWKYFFAPQKVELVPEDDNPQDPKAIKVVVDGQHVGYIKSGSCAHLRKVMDRGGIADIDCVIGGGPYKYVALEYDDETDKEIYTLEKDETHIFVHLDITEKA